MKVILKQTVPKVGKEGQVVKVKNGFARNFLFPRGMATVADKAQLKVLEARNKKLESKLAETKAAADAIAEKLSGGELRIEVKSGIGARLFGAVTAQDLADAIKEQLGVEVEKKAVGILQPIKQLGSFTIEIDLHRQVDCKIVANIIDPVKEQQAVADAAGLADQLAEDETAEGESAETTSEEAAPAETEPAEDGTAEVESADSDSEEAAPAESEPAEEPSPEAAKES
ncbi:MAG: 50S ribosomal protein L9 [Armatimonadetes bacterium]|nr:50S ribosomal protein L9 [Armatimonadota bacterium]